MHLIVGALPNIINAGGPEHQKHATNPEPCARSLVYDVVGAKPPLKSYGISPRSILQWSFFLSDAHNNNVRGYNYIHTLWRMQCLKRLCLATTYRAPRYKGHTPCTGYCNGNMTYFIYCSLKEIMWRRPTVIVLLIVIFHLSIVPL